MSQTDSDILVAMSRSQLVRIGLVGALVGATAWGLTTALDVYVLRLVVCQGQYCASSLGYASAIAAVIAATVGMVGLVKLATFRALLVVLTATFSLWGLMAVLAPVPWQSALIASILLYAVAYSLLAWISRIRVATVVLIIMVIVIVAARLTLIA